MNTTEAVRAIVAGAPHAHCVSSLGTSTSALRLATDDAPHLYLGGSMGSGLAVAIGVADRCPDRRIVAIVGDGDLLMGASALWTLAGLRPQNLTAVIVSDGRYSITGGQELVADAQAGAVGAALGLETLVVEDPEALERAVAEGAHRLIEARVEAGAEWPGPSPFVDPHQVRMRFADALAEGLAVTA